MLVAAVPVGLSRNGGAVGLLQHGDKKSLTADEDLIARTVPGSGGSAWEFQHRIKRCGVQNTSCEVT